MSRLHTPSCAALPGAGRRTWLSHLGTLGALHALAAFGVGMPSAARAADGAGVAAAQPGAQAGAAPMSEAERLVFVEPHLHNLQPPATLRYRFERRGTLEPGYAEDVVLGLQRSAGGGCCDVSAPPATAPRQLPLPPIDDAKSNPVLLYFLEHDVRELQRRTGGQANYFRRRLRQALVDRARIESTRVTLGDRELPARVVQVQPYADDPRRARYERYAALQYRFVLGDAVPGGVYELHTLLPGAEGAAPLLEEVLTLQSAAAGAPETDSPRKPGP